MTGRSLWTALGVIAVAGFFMYLLYRLSEGPAGTMSTADTKLPLLAIGGVVAMLGSLAVVSIIFAAFGLDDKSQALALPDGSIRAVIALCLIILFAILSFYLYGNMATSSLKTAPDLSVQDKDKLVAAVGQNLVAVSQPTDDKFTVYYRDLRDPSSSDFAKQLLVMIGTLVTSIASFYFGAKTAAADTDRTDAKPDPRARGVRPDTYARAAGPGDFEIAGDNLDAVREVKFRFGASQVVATGVVSNPSVVKCQAVIDTTQPAGDWDIVVTDASGKTSDLPHSLRVT